MEHFVSINLEPGISSTAMKKAPLGDVLKEALHNAPEAKEDCWLMSNGYKDTSGLYTREEWNFQWIDTVLIDCDNGKDDDPSTWDAGILDKFKDEYSEYAYFLWETFSSKPERPKFRAIILLDERVEWVNEPSKFTKEAIKQLFAKYTDVKASWFFTPPKGKVSTFTVHKGIPYPSAKILSLVNLNREMWSLRQPSKAAQWDNAQREFGHNPDGWRKFKTVKECLGHALPPHERHDPLFKACSAMALNGYKDAIPQFLSEVDCPLNHKREMLRQFK